MVGRANRVCVVLDHEDRASGVGERAEIPEEAARVAWMKTDRRLVEHVERTGQAGTELGCQPKPLHLATGQGRPVAIERQVPETDVDDEREPPLELLRGRVGNAARRRP